MNPLNHIILANNSKRLQDQMTTNWRPASHLSEMDERGFQRAAIAMAHAYLSARFICYLAS